MGGQIKFEPNLKQTFNYVKAPLDFGYRYTWICK